MIVAIVAEEMNKIPFCNSEEGTSLLRSEVDENEATVNNNNTHASGRVKSSSRWDSTKSFIGTSSFLASLWTRKKNNENRQESEIILSQEGHHSCENTSNNKASKLWAKVREKLPDLNLMESSRTANITNPKGENLGSSVEKHVTIHLGMCLLAIVAYLGIGAISFSYFFEQWPIVDSLYFSMVTFTTVGYGDFYPSTPVGQVFTAIYSIVGITFLGLALGVIGGRVVEYETTMIVQAETALQQRLQESVRNLFQGGNESSGEKQQVSTVKKNKRPIVLWLQTYTIVFLTLLMGSLFIGYMEDWGWQKSVYFCTMTATTVGYGDFVPSSPRMRLFAVFYIPLLVGVMTHLLGSLAKLFLDLKIKSLMQHMNKRQLQVADLLEIGHDDGNVSEIDFVAFMLCKMQKVDNELMEELRSQFRHFDVDGNGYVSKSDLYQIFLSGLKRTDKKLQLSEYKKRLISSSSMDRAAITPRTIGSTVIGSVTYGTT